MTEKINGYVWENAELNSSHDYLLPALKKLLARETLPQGGKRLFELGCAVSGQMDALFTALWDHGHINVLVRADSQVAAGRSGFPGHSVHASGPHSTFGQVNDRDCV